VEIAERPQNKHLRPWTKETRPTPKNPGRPKKVNWLEELERVASQPKERLAMLRRLCRKYPVDAMHYLAGKPLEQIRLDASITTAVAPRTLEAAAAIARTLMQGPGTVQDASQKSPLSLPSDEIKVAHKPIVEAETTITET
jgi:hypothetical protein